MPSFLRAPPFPGSHGAELADGPSEQVQLDQSLAALLRRHRVGGNFWAAQPTLAKPYWILGGDTAEVDLRRLVKGAAIIRWEDSSCDLWHLVEGAEAVIGDLCEEVSTVARLLGVPLWAPHEDGNLGVVPADRPILSSLPTGFRNPFSGDPMSVREAIELCGFWRRLIDSNRRIMGGVGFARWKQANVAPLLWNGSSDFRFLSSPPKDGTVALWRARTPAAALSAIKKAGTPIVEVEDGFLRSRGLGADCVPPLSITVDHLGPYFDPSRASELELLLQEGSFDPALLDRAARLRSIIVAAGLGKYDAGSEVLERPGGSRPHILVPGQVEDDRAVLLGGGGLTSNLELLKRAREAEPDAYIIYKPHPDVVAGHRKGAIAARDCLKFADLIVEEQSMGALLDMVDAVHVNTSLAGFEALLREKPVTTHGVPFYAGWGLTHDLGPIPQRRTTRRTLDELVAATLLLYPRYLDPVTGLPCPAEVVVDRLAGGEAGEPSLIVRLRRLQGRVSAGVRKLVG